MSEYELREFNKHLEEEGYMQEVPEGLEFLASLAAFYTKFRKKLVLVKEI